MTIKIYEDLEQGSDEWLAARCGLLTASEMKLIITPTLKVADNDKSRCHLYELLAQRITNYVEPHYVSDDMLRGHEDEIEAKILYNRIFDPVRETGFITNDKWGFTLGYSPDGLVGDDGLIECKSRRQKYQVQTILSGVVPDEYVIQLQTGLLVSERKWIDFITYSGGLPMMAIRVWPDAAIQDAILKAAAAFENNIAQKLNDWDGCMSDISLRLTPTERRVEEEIAL